jgi:hypothetical protein
MVSKEEELISLQRMIAKLEREYAIENAEEYLSMYDDGRQSNEN